MTEPLGPLRCGPLEHPIGPQRGPVMQPKGAEPLSSAPLGIADHITPIPFPDRNAVPSRVLRFRVAARLTEPR